MINMEVLFVQFLDMIVSSMTKKALKLNYNLECNI
jgi:hypothetical protein